MKETIRQRLQKLSDRFEEVGRLLASSQVSGSSQQFRDLSMEYARLQPLAERLARYSGLEEELGAAQELQSDADAGLRALGSEEVVRLQGELVREEAQLRQLLLPKDTRDDKNIFLEVRAGIAGKGAFSRLKFESGTHRVQRVPATEAQGRIHTSACTVAILPELDEVDEVEINPADLRIDTYRSSGAGGQHVNKTDSAVRITHLPSGIVVECQDERSQHKNRSRAMALLAARLLASEQAKQLAAQAQSRKLQVGSGDRSERIRTYNYPQGRVTDHRINLTLYRLADIMQGQIEELLQALQQEYQAELLAAE